MVWVCQNTKRQSHKSQTCVACARPSNPHALKVLLLVSMSGLHCYASRYDDVRNTFCQGSIASCDFHKLQQHWDTSGIVEGRTLECLPETGPSAEALAIQQAVRHGGFVHMPQGDVYFGNSNLLIEGAEGLHLHGTGPQNSRLWFEPGHGVKLVSCRNVSIGGFSIDCSQAPFAQGRISSVSPGEQQLDFVLEEGFPSPTTTGLFAWSNEIKVIYWDPVSRRMHTGQSMVNPALRFAWLGNSSYRLWLATPMDFVPMRGDLVSISPRMWSTEHPMPSYYKGTFLLQNSARVTVEDVDVHCSATMTLLEVGGWGGHVYRRVNIRRRPQPAYPARLLATNSDGLHSFSVLHGPRLEHSHFEFLADDFINVHSRVWPVIGHKHLGKSLVVIDPSAAHGADLGIVHVPHTIAPGTRIHVFDFKSRALLGSATVDTVYQSKSIPNRVKVANGFELQAVTGTKTFDEGAARVFLLHLTSTHQFAAKILPYSAFVQFEDTGGAEIVNNTFTDTYNNLARIAASNSLIKGNRFEHGQDGIHVRFLPEFLEGQAAVRNVSIHDNSFFSIRGCGPSACVRMCLDMSCLLQNVDSEVRQHLWHHGNRVVSSLSSATVEDTDTVRAAAAHDAVFAANSFSTERIITSTAFPAVHQVGPRPSLPHKVAAITHPSTRAHQRAISLLRTGEERFDDWPTMVLEKSQCDELALWMRWFRLGEWSLKLRSPCSALGIGHTEFCKNNSFSKVTCTAASIESGRMRTDVANAITFAQRYRHTLWNGARAIQPSCMLARLNHLESPQRPRGACLPLLSSQWLCCTVDLPCVHVACEL